MADNFLARFSFGQGYRNALEQPSPVDDEAVQNALAMGAYQQPRSGLDRDTFLPWAYDVKDGVRSSNGMLAAPQMAVDAWNAVKGVGSAPLTAPYNPAERDSMIEHAGAVVGPMAGVGIARGAMAPAGSSELGIFGGRLAKTADRNKLAAAEWAEKTGVPRERIWNDTGWFKGVDGQWRFEIPDHGATFSEKKGFFGGVKDALLSDRLNHPGLAAAYPDVAQIPTKSVGGFADAYYQVPTAARAEEIGYSKYFATDEGKRNALLHEVQHAIQNREGFTDGSPPPGRGYTEDIYPRLAGEVEARAVEARRNMTPDERATRPPWLDYDVPESQQLVTFRGDGPQYSLPMDRPGIRAYHGSPHDFDRFDLSKIGTGEGAQAYGHGLYFAESEGVAKNYRDALADIKVAGQEPDLKRPDHWMAMALDAAQGDRAKAVADLRRDMASQFPDNRPAIDDAIRRIESGNIPELPPVSDRGRLYEVSIKADPEDFLDWDKPLSQQSEKVRKALGVGDARGTERASNLASELEGVYRDLAEATGAREAELIKRAHAIEDELAKLDPTGAAQWKIEANASGPETSKRLREAGIPGIKYLDQGSRSAGDGSRNYVVFDDALVQILRKYGLLPPAVAGAVAASGQDQAQARP